MPLIGYKNDSREHWEILREWERRGGTAANWLRAVEYRTWVARFAERPLARLRGEIEIYVATASRVFGVPSVTIYADLDRADQILREEREVAVLEGMWEPKP